MLVITRVRTSAPSVASPTAETKPPTPFPGITGNCGSRARGALPARIWVSTKVMFAISTSISAWPGPGTGSGTSAGTRTSGGPNSLSRTARTGSP